MLPSIATIFQSVCRSTLVKHERFADVPQNFGGRSKRNEKRNVEIHFKNNAVIRILAVELLNTILFAFNHKIFI